MDKTIEEGHSMMKIVCKIIEVRILEVDIEVTLGVINLEEVEVGLGKDSSQAILGEITEAVVDLDQIQEQVPIEVELDASSVDHFAKDCLNISYTEKRTVGADTSNAKLRRGQDIIKGSCGRHL